MPSRPLARKSLCLVVVSCVLTCQLERLAAVESFPPFTSLVPVFGVFGLAQSAAQASEPALVNLLSSYIANIRYADPDDKVISFDKAARFKACDDAMAAVGRAREVLAKSTADKTSFQKEVSSIGVNLASFFALIPKEDFKKAEALSQKMRLLDAESC
eukprot:g25718.t1